MPLFDAVLIGGLSRETLQPQGEAGMGFFKEKVMGEGSFSCSYGQLPQGFRMGIGKMG